MSWKQIPYHELPRWVKKRSKWRHLKGRTYLYKREGTIWYKRLRNDWADPTPWWVLILIAVAATIIATILLNLGYRFFR